MSRHIARSGRPIRFQGRDQVRVGLYRDGRGRIVLPMTSFSPFDKRLLEEGLGYFDRPRLATLLELLGSERPRRKRGQTAAEWRRQRRLSI